MSEAERVIAAQLGRDLRASSEVVSTCHLGLPVVISVPPLLDDGTPFPTRYWLTCPLAVRRIARLESTGAIKQVDQRAERDPEFGLRLQRAHDRYRDERDTLIPESAEHRPRGGVGGAVAGVKCLHAHYADHVACDVRANGDNPVGEVVAAVIEPLDCAVRCVVDNQRNPSWREPKRANL